jgi:pimeloyl-ACP methyl ester carboxylesterase
MHESISSHGICYRTNDFNPGLKTLVFIHGLSGSLSAWDQYEKCFQNQYNILTYDLRGHGKTVRPEGYAEYSIDHFVNDLHDLLSELNIGKCVLVAHSFGTLIALEFMLSYPGVVEAAIFLSPAFANGESAAAHIEYPFIWLLRQLVSIFPMIRRVGIHLDYSRYYGCGDWNIRRISADVPNTGFHSYFNCLDHIYRYRCGDLSRVTAPVLLIHGKKDTYSSYKTSVVAATRIQNCKLVLLEKANHIIVLNNFEEVAGEMGKFLSLLK